MSDFLSILLVASLAAPSAFLAACFVKRWRQRALALQWLAPIPGLAAGLAGVNRAPLTHELSLLGFTLRLDPPAALLLAGSALLWIVVSAALWRDHEPDHRFGVCWLVTMIGNIGVFVAGDLVSFLAKRCCCSPSRCSWQASRMEARASWTRWTHCAPHPGETRL